MGRRGLATGTAQRPSTRRPLSSPGVQRAPPAGRPNSPPKMAAGAQRCSGRSWVQRLTAGPARWLCPSPTREAEPQGKKPGGDWRRRPASRCRRACAVRANALPTRGGGGGGCRWGEGGVPRVLRNAARMRTSHLEEKTRARKGPWRRCVCLRPWSSSLRFPLAGCGLHRMPARSPKRWQPQGTPSSARDRRRQRYLCDRSLQLVGAGHCLFQASYHSNS